MADQLEMTYQDIQKEIEKAQKRAAKATFIEAKKEFAEETYPILESVVEFFGERFERIERAVAELIDQTESFVQPELADQIHATFAIGRQLALLVSRLRVGALDGVTLKRLSAAGVAFVNAADETETAVAQVTVAPPEEDGEDDDGEEGDEEGDEEGEEPIEVAAEPAPSDEAPAPAPVQEQP